MNKKIIFPLCLLLVVVWTAGCTCPGPQAPGTPARRGGPAAASPAAREPVVCPPPCPMPEPSKKLKERVIY